MGKGGDLLEPDAPDAPLICFSNFKKIYLNKMHHCVSVIELRMQKMRSAEDRRKPKQEQRQLLSCLQFRMKQIKTLQFRKKHIKLCN